jgi:hypothetical protein
MTDTAPELDLIRTQLRAAIERDLGTRRPRSRVAHRRSFRIAIPTLAALAAATAAVVVGLTLSAAPPSDASSAARRALAATAAAPSGTMATTVLHVGVTQTVDAASWNGSDIAFSPGDGSIRQLLLIGGGMYVQTPDGGWLHYADASDVGPKPLGGMAQLARDNIAGTVPEQILALATGVQKATQSDGTTVYTGTIPSSSLDPAKLPGNDAITSMILGAQKRTASMFGIGPEQGDATGSLQSDLQFQMGVGAGGLVSQLSVTFQQGGTYTWSVTYSQLGTTPPITAPASSTDVPPGTLPPEIQPPASAGQTVSGAITPADQSAYLSAARCMRAHGVPDFPDPTFENNTVTFNIPPSIDPSSSQARSAEAICASLIPAGLPYSNRSAP